MTPQDPVAGIRQDRPTREDLLDRARELASRLRERAERCEAERCVPVETIEDFRRSELIRMSMPARYNG